MGVIKKTLGKNQKQRIMGNSLGKYLGLVNRSITSEQIPWTTQVEAVNIGKGAKTRMKTIPVKPSKFGDITNKSLHCVVYILTKIDYDMIKVHSNSFVQEECKTRVYIEISDAIV